MNEQEKQEKAANILAENELDKIAGGGRSGSGEKNIPDDVRWEEMAAADDKHHIYFGFPCKYCKAESNGKYSVYIGGDIYEKTLSMKCFACGATYW